MYWVGFPQNLTSLSIKILKLRTLIHETSEVWCLRVYESPNSNFTLRKSVRICSCSGPYFPTFGLNTERYPYLSVFSPNAGKCGPEQPRIRTLFTQCYACVTITVYSLFYSFIYQFVDNLQILSKIL